MTELGKPIRLQSYSKWTARFALIVLGLTFVFALAMLPIHESHGGGAAGTVWPLSSHFGHRHLIACLELALGWGVAGIVALVLTGIGIQRLLRRAEWGE